MSVLRFVCLGLFLSMIARPVLAEQDMPPPLPCSLQGTVVVNDASVPAGTVITVGSGAVVYQTSTTTVFEGTSVYNLVVPGDRPDTEAREGALEGETLEFTVGGLRAAQTATWTSGVILSLNLAAAGPTLTPSATSNATPRPSFTPSNTPIPSATPSPTEPLEQAIMYPASDTFINSWYPPTNYDASQYLTVRQGDVIASLFRFDVTSLAGKQIRSARLQVYANQRSNSAQLTISAYQVRRAWTSNQVTWALARTGVAWALPGCNGQGADRDAVASSTVVANAINKWYSLDVTDMVRAWAGDTAQNQGLVLKGAGSTSVEYNFAAKELADTAVRPRLVVHTALEAVATSTATPAQVSTQTPTETPVAWESATPTRTVPSTDTATPSSVPATTPTPTATLQPSHTPSGTPVPSPTPSPAQPSEETVFSSAEDTYVNSWYPSTNYNYALHANVRQGDVMAALLRFDLLGLTGKEVQSARLELYAVERTNTAPMTISAYRVRRAWVGNQATWTQAGMGVAWDRPGCNGEGADRDATASGAISVDAIGRWYSLDVTDMVRAWVADAAQNQGLVLKGTGRASVEYGFASREWADTTLRPRLVVQAALVPLGTTTATPTQAPVQTSTGTATLTPATPAASATPSPTQRTDQAVLNPASDTYINSWYPSTNYYYALSANVRQGDVIAALLRFDLLGLTGKEVRSARLELYAVERTNTAPMTISAYRVRRAWVGNQATWTQAGMGVAWDRPGCNGEGADRDATASGAISVDAIGRWYSLDVTDMVRAWVADAAQNQGLVLKGTGRASVEYGFASREWADATLRPKLVVQTVPESALGAHIVTPGPTSSSATAVLLPLVLAGQ